MTAIYYPCVASVACSEVFFLWFTNDVDGIHFENGKMTTFVSLEECVRFVRSRNLELGERQPQPFDLNRAADWLSTPERSPVDPVILLTTWNIIEDFLRSRAPAGSPFPLGKRHVYEKLFWANNLPAVTPHGERFEPEWSLQERREIASALANPLSEFLTALQE